MMQVLQSLLDLKRSVEEDDLLDLKTCYPFQGQNGGHFRDKKNGKYALGRDIRTQVN